MDGILFLEGYKLKHRINLNLQKHTVLLSHSDMFTPVILFDLIERYFNKRNFDDYDEMEDILLDLTGRQYRAEELKKQLLIDLFDEKTYERKYKEIDKIFRI